LLFVNKINNYLLGEVIGLAKVEVEGSNPFARSKNSIY